MEEVTVVKVLALYLLDIKTFHPSKNKILFISDFYITVATPTETKTYNVALWLMESDHAPLQKVSN